MRWRYSYSWTVFLICNAAMQAIIFSSWSQRVLGFLITTVPISVWVWLQMRKANGS